MLGLLGTLNMGARSLQAQQQGLEIAGHNLANVNNPAYARQRVNLRTTAAVAGPSGLQGAGVEVAGIQQLRDLLLDRQIENELSVSGYWASVQQSLQYAQANLGQQLDRNASGAEGAAAAQGAGGQPGLAESLQDLFGAFQSLSTGPTSLTERQVLLQKAATLADKLRLTDERLGALRADLDDSLRESVSRANDLLAGIAHLNRQIADLESRSAGAANDLRDTRQEKLEALAKLVKLDVSTRPDGSLGIAIAGTEMVNGGELAGSLTAQDDGSGRVKVRGADGTPLNLTGGSMQGVIDARDDTVAALRDRLDRLAGALIREVNAAHAGGFSLEQTTGALFFAGTGAASIAVNPELLENPARVQASGAAEAVGDNQVALRLAQLADQKLPALNDQTLIQAYGQTVASLGQSLAGANAQVGDQGVIEAMLQRQRDSTGGVSLDEEMTQMVKFQKAFQASARLIATLDEMLDTVMSMKR